ncbi:MAG: transporter substrate-binding domain-containing protein [Syntrophorhabdales bacterium]
MRIIPDFIQGFRMLATGAVDALVADRWVGSYVLAENNIRGVKLIEEPISRSNSAIAVKKGNANLLRGINLALADIRRDGTYDKIIKSWRSKEVVFKTREQLRQQAWLIEAITAALLVALVGVAVLVREIRRRKRVEEALRESGAKLEAALASMTDAVFISDTEGRFIDFNDAFATLHKFRSKDECSKTFAEYPDILDVFLPDGTPVPVDMWAVPRALRGETATNAEYTPCGVKMRVKPGLGVTVSVPSATKTG